MILFYAVDIAYAVSVLLIAIFWIASFVLSSVIYPFLMSKNFTLPSIEDAQIYQSLQITLETESLKLFIV